jgi:hypothetical protein
LVIGLGQHELRVPGDQQFEIGVHVAVVQGANLDAAHGFSSLSGG